MGLQPCHLLPRGPPALPALRGDPVHGPGHGAPLPLSGERGGLAGGARCEAGGGSRPATGEPCGSGGASRPPQGSATRAAWAASAAAASELPPASATASELPPRRLRAAAAAHRPLKLRRGRGGGGGEAEGRAGVPAVTCPSPAAPTRGELRAPRAGPGERGRVPISVCVEGRKTPTGRSQGFAALRRGREDVSEREAKRCGWRQVAKVRGGGHGGKGAAWLREGSRAGAAAVTGP